MKCEDLQFNLPVYADGILNDEERAAVEAHLSQCPLCRQKLADFQELRNSLRTFARPEMSSQLLNSLRGAVAAELQTDFQKSKSIFSNDFKEWLQMRVMPYGVGAFASVILGFTLLWSLLSAARIEPNDNSAQYDSFSKSTVLLANANPKNNRGDSDLTPSEYARSRFAISAESPSVNPQGALIALTKSLMSDDVIDKEVVVVADVYGNGLAEIAEVVEPSQNRYAVYELEKALKTDADDAPFVPADLDRRSDSVRVVFKIQSVNVKTNLKPVQQ
jgi:hypothetical protein